MFFFKYEMATFAESSILNVKICRYFSMSLMIVKEESLGFGLLVGQKKQFKDIALSSGKHLKPFYRLIQCINGRLIDNKSNCELQLCIILCIVTQTEL